MLLLLLMLLLVLLLLFVVVVIVVNVADAFVVDIVSVVVDDVVAKT